MWLSQGRLCVCYVTSLPQGLSALLMTGQAEQVEGWATLTQRQEPLPRCPGGKESSVRARWMDNGISILELGR